MAESTIDVNALGQALDTTWGRSSTPKTASYSVKLMRHGPDRLIATYGAVVNFGTERQMIEMKRRYASESESVINEVMKQVKANYKDLAGTSISVKEVTTNDEIEIISTNFHNPKRSAIYRRRTVFEIG